MKRHDYEGYPEIHKKSSQVCENYQITCVIDNSDDNCTHCLKCTDCSKISQQLKDSECIRIAQNNFNGCMCYNHQQEGNDEDI